MTWVRIKQVDYSPRKKCEVEFTDYKSGDFLLCDYVDVWHVFHKKKFITRVKTLREAKQVVRWMRGEERLPTFKRGVRKVRIRRR
jgi:hypothetical protein